MDQMTTTVILSIEIELAWGYHDLSNSNKYATLSDDRTSETETLKRLLSVCDELSIPITFNVVGHLMTESCSGSHDGPYPENWFAADPGSDRDRDPLFYAPELVNLIQQTNVNHEICTHTYSHILCEEMSEEVIKWDLRSAMETHVDFGLDIPVSLVPPRHQTPSCDVLDSAGIRVVRKAISSDRPSSSLFSFGWILARSHPLSSVTEDDGVIETTVTSYPSLTATHLPNGRRPPHPSFSVIPVRVRRHLHLRFLNQALARAIDSDGHLHLWTHLSNLSNEHQLSVVCQFLNILAQRRDEKATEILRMADLTN